MTADQEVHAAWIDVPSPDELPVEVAVEIGDVSERPTELGLDETANIFA